MTPADHRRTSRSDLLRLGFVDLDRAVVELEELGMDAADLLAFLGQTADPDAALAALCRLADAVEDRAALLTALRDDEGTAMRLLCVLGASTALADHLCHHPEQWLELTDPDLGSTRPAAWAMRASLLAAVGADAANPVPVATAPDNEAVDALRVEYRRQLLRLASRDLTHHLGVDDAAAELSDLAAGTLDAALAVARQRIGPECATVRLGVIAMGKCGGHELNYVSDVDVIFLHAPTDPDADDAVVAASGRIASRLAAQLMQVCSQHTAEGTIWPVDAALRPEGKAGPLSRTLASHQSYYERWAEQWEFQALLKARPVAGDLALGQAFVDMVAPMVWSAADREGFVDAARAMRRRVLEHIPAKEAERQLKLGAGGLRDVEFAVQLLQLVHGRADERIRPSTTLSALAELSRGGYVGREDGEALHRAYGFLRQLEHRIQLHRMQRTHVVPSDAPSMRRLGRSLGFLKESEKRLDETWQGYRREVSRLHQKIFYRPLLSAVARIGSDEVRLSSEAAGARLTALGYADAEAALRNLEALTAGVSRTSAIQRTLLPAMLQWFAECPDPDGGLFGFRRISEALGRTPWYLSTLRDEGEVAERLAHLLATSRYCTDLLEREPAGVRLLAGDLRPLGSDALTEEMLATAGRQEGDKAVRAVRAVRRRELLRIAAGDVLGLVTVDEVGFALSRLTDATLEVTLEVAGQTVRRQRHLESAPTRMAIVAMGRYGGFELSYGSDADVLFVHDPVDGADAHQAGSYARAVAEEVRRALGAPGPDPALVVDADLRPEGRQGALVRTLESYAAYYAKWSHVWEAQALLRADAVVGDPVLRERFTALIDPLRYPEQGLSDDDVVEVRRIKGRVDKERLPRNADPTLHFKLGRGGLADIEWTVQLLQLRHGAQVEGLRTAQTLAALAAAADADLLTHEDAETLATSWRMASRVRNGLLLARGRAGDQFPRATLERRAMAGILGYQLDETDRVLDDYLRITRRARAVVDRVFWE
ncbi:MULTISPECIES: bifunctional [glutamine synthetase] adenylyltransferase/[glutamine synthetase]-adenylyl-L-tyrosine phosphorylase [unclassified Nocardioides]|uniref:bifunctional [glutamine synthetase] adenylyltransferase/[glutamine synthetase]-adenylyl-L-tyrosine phosphorylase n=1 Tax=unclassified Nocardioides TaxID=2615069 RepID=UPI0006FC05C5|nr:MULTISPECIES: bifunctional [glutamine synthetase] adenylyltransferase/[glutamine synthetase]-adenylyl-L-tyrosine phosphorylase [unclassified Nocardioides]KRA32430.1 glutamine-synthetase adenylyltransferase [Nocardioides sp. Root614]KRA89083.1 glutamine-synthetase adenylyltransferase [Nocardioides sp. Root682]